MREITKTLSVLVDGQSRDFRLTKLEAFSGVSLLRMLAKLPAENAYVSISAFAIFIMLSMSAPSTSSPMALINLNSGMP